VIVSDAIARHFEKNMLWAGLTYSGHPVCCAAAVANLNLYEKSTSSPTLSDKALSRLALEAMKQKYRCVATCATLASLASWNS